MFEEINKIIIDNRSPMRGRIHEIEFNKFRLDYYDIYEEDSSMQYLMSKQLQGGGETWYGIINQAIKFVNPSLNNGVDFDPEADGLAIWSNNKSKLEQISRLINVIKTEESFLVNCVETAKITGTIE